MSSRNDAVAPDSTAEIDALLRGWVLDDEQRAVLRGRNECAELQASRLGRLRTIIGGLYLLFPENPELRRDWVQRANMPRWTDAARCRRSWRTRMACRWSRS